jgi:hypothetical protein
MVLKYDVDLNISKNMVLVHLNIIKKNKGVAHPFIFKNIKETKKSLQNKDQNFETKNFIKV